MTMGYGGEDVQVESGPRPPKLMISGGYKFMVICTRQRVLKHREKNSGTFWSNSKKRLIWLNFTGWFNKLKERQEKLAGSNYN